VTSGQRASTTAKDMRRVGDGALAIVWSDGAESVLPLREIRLACGCAVCRDETSGAPLLDPAGVPLDLRASRIAPVGNYALTFDWSDGHSTGIYPWEELRALADRLGVTQPAGSAPG
jgi:ATP-binding protein involved in chromosome partitioning